MIFTRSTYFTVSGRCRPKMIGWMGESRPSRWMMVVVDGRGIGSGSSRGRTPEGGSSLDGSRDLFEERRFKKSEGN